MTAYEMRISDWSSDVCSSDLIENLVTYPVEISLAGIPGLESTRSISRNGFSQVTAIFTDKTDLYFARQQVGERLIKAQESLPDGVQPQIGPVTTGLGEVLLYTVGYTYPDGEEAQKDRKSTRLNSSH